ncbi:MAG: hypothetical protein WKF59_26125 [Chitinophagaceae bacterium]
MTTSSNAVMVMSCDKLFISLIKIGVLSIIIGSLLKRLPKDGSQLIFGKEIRLLKVFRG